MGGVGLDQRSHALLILGGVNADATRKAVTMKRLRLRFVIFFFVLVVIVASGWLNTGLCETGFLGLCRSPRHLWINGREDAFINPLSEKMKEKWS